MKLARGLTVLALLLTESVTTADTESVTTADTSNSLRGKKDRELQGRGNEGQGQGKGRGPKDDDEDGAMTGEVIISRKSIKRLQREGKTPSEITDIRARGRSKINQNRVVYESSAADSDFQVVEVGKGNERAFIARLMAEDETEGLFAYAEPNLIHTIDVTPDDPNIAQQWHHTNMASYAAWDIETGEEAVTVGICDTGLQLDHPDLMANRLPGYHATQQVSNFIMFVVLSQWIPFPLLVSTSAHDT